KRAVARFTREAIQLAASNNQQTTKEGQIGSLGYQVGVYYFESYWETNYGGKREIHARRSGRVPFVALKIVDGEHKAKSRGDEGAVVHPLISSPPPLLTFGRT